GARDRPPTRPYRLLELDVEYDITGVSGSIATNFAGTAAPFCDPLDACGSHGMSSFAVQGSDGHLSIDAHRILGKHERPSLARALRVLTRGRLTVEGFLNLEDGNSRTRVSSSVVRSDGATCTEG